MVRGGIAYIYSLFICLKRFDKLDGLVALNLATKRTLPMQIREFHGISSLSSRTVGSGWSPRTGPKGQSQAYWVGERFE